MWVRSIPAVVTTVIRPVKPGSRLVRSSTLTPQTSSLDAGKRDFSVSFSWLCSLPLFVFCLQHCFFFFALTIFFSTTTLKHKNILSGILLIFYYVLMFFFRLLQSNSLLVFPLFCISLAVIYFWLQQSVFLLFRFLITFRKRLDNFHYYTEWN